MPVPGRNGYYTGQMFTNELGERYVWIGNEWRTAGNDNYTPVSNAREVNITFNTFLEEGGVPVQAKVLVNGTEWVDSTSINGKATVKFFDYQILNPTKITFLGNNVKTKKEYVIQARVNQENDVVIRELNDGEEVIQPSPIFNPIDIVSPIGRGSGGGGGFVERDFGTGFGREVVVDRDMNQRENIR